MVVIDLKGSHKKRPREDGQKERRERRREEEVKCIAGFESPSSFFNVFLRSLINEN